MFLIILQFIILMRHFHAVFVFAISIVFYSLVLRSCDIAASPSDAFYGREISADALNTFRLDIITTHFWNTRRS